MRVALAILCLVTGILLPLGCDTDRSPATSPAPADSQDKLVSHPQPGLYTVGWTNAGPVMVEKIDLRTGLGSYVSALDLTGYNGPIVTPFGYAFDFDGTMYAFVSWGDGSPENAGSQFVRVDMQTGALTPIGQPFHINFAGPDIDACGNLYVTGFTEILNRVSGWARLEPAWFRRGRRGGARSLHQGTPADTHMDWMCARR